MMPIQLPRGRRSPDPAADGPGRQGAAARIRHEDVSCSSRSFSVERLGRPHRRDEGRREDAVDTFPDTQPGARWDQGPPLVLQPIRLLDLCLRAWPGLRGRPGLGDPPTAQALVYALSRLSFLTSEERAQLDLLRALLPKALLALDAPASEALGLWLSLAPAANPRVLAAALRRAEAVAVHQEQAMALSLAADLVEDAWWEGRRSSVTCLSAAGRLAVARALAWGSLRGTLARGLNGSSVAAAAGLRALIGQLSAGGGVAAGGGGRRGDPSVDTPPSPQRSSPRPSSSATAVSKDPRISR